MEKILPSFTEPKTSLDFAQIYVNAGYSKKSYLVHKEVVLNSSPFLYHELRGGNRNIIYMDKAIESHVFGLAVHWMYTKQIDTITNPSIKTLASLCALAKHLDMQDLETAALNSFRQALNDELLKDVNREFLNLVHHIYTLKNGEAVKANLLVEVADKVITGRIPQSGFWIQKLPHQMMLDVKGALRLIDDEKHHFKAMNPLKQEIYSGYMKKKYS